MGFSSEKIIRMRDDALRNEYNNLNDMQRAAVFKVDGPVLILAGAGSGKTTVLVNRISNMIRFGSAFGSEIVPQLTEEEEKELERAAGKAEDENGTGISSELARKLAVNPVMPWSILAITFTNKAAGELKDRIMAKVQDGGDDIWAATFHSTCARILRRYADRIGYTSNFTVYDTSDQQRLIKECMNDLHVDEKLLPHKSILKEISKCKDSMLTPNAFKDKAGTDSRLVTVSKVYEMYQRRLVDADAMDFDDLIFQTVRLLEKNEDILDYYQNKFKYIMVDEYQDTNKVQYRLISLLADRYRNICVVGDDDQSIYKFRGATIENILSFEDTYPDAKVVRLEQNYRSTQNILDVANCVIANNTQRKEKRLWTQKEKGANVRLHTAGSERDEAKFITEEILDYVNDGGRYSNVAVLYRMNAQSNSIEQYFARSGIPYRLIGGHRFYDREEIKDMLAYLQVIANQNDEIRLKRIINKPKRGIGDTTINKADDIAKNIGESLFDVINRADEFDTLKKARGKLDEFCKLIGMLIEKSEELSIADLYSLILKETGYIAALENEKKNDDKMQTRIENINELLTNIKKYEEENEEEASLTGFLEEVSLFTDIDNYDKDADSVVMMTVHSAKGLEFPVVFIPGMEDGIFPGMQNMLYPEEMQEERRLAYVGFTRAMERLYLVNASSRMLFGYTNRNRPSRFISEIPKEMLEETTSVKTFETVKPAATGAYAGYKQQTFNQSAFDSKSKLQTSSEDILKVGEKVRHKAFGEGIILSSVKMGNDNLLEVAFDTVGTKKIMENFAKLKKL